MYNTDSDWSTSFETFNNEDSRYHRGQIPKKTTKTKKLKKFVTGHKNSFKESGIGLNQLIDRSPSVEIKKVI